MKGRVLSIRVHLALLALLVLTPQIVLGGYLAYRNASETQASVENSTSALARTVSGAVDRELVGVVGVLQGLSTASSLHRKDFAEFSSRATAAFRTSKASGVALRDAAGTILVNTNAAPGAPLPPSNPALREFDKEVIASGRAASLRRAPGPPESIARPRKQRWRSAWGSLPIGTDLAWNFCAIHDGRGRGQLPIWRCLPACGRPLSLRSFV